jgi:hypothetical protein
MSSATRRSCLASTKTEASPTGSCDTRQQAKLVKSSSSTQSSYTSSDIRAVALILITEERFLKVLSRELFKPVKTLILLELI